MIPMMSSDRAFEQAANAFAAVTTPAYVSYTENVDLESKTLHLTVRATNAVVRRVSDDVSLVTYQSVNRTYRRERRLIPPTFNALSDFVLRGSFSSNGDLKLWVEQQTPLHYDLVPRPGIDSVSVSLQKYRTRYVDDAGPDTIHIHLDSANGETNILPRLFFKEVYIGAKSGFPERVEFVGPDQRNFDVHYTVSNGRPWLDSYLFAQTFSAGFGIVRARATLHMSYSGIEVPTGVNDAAFDPPASPSPAPS